MRAKAGCGHTMLVETLAERGAVAVLTDRRVVRVRVSVEKPEAFGDADAVDVTVGGDRGDVAASRGTA